MSNLTTRYLENLWVLVYMDCSCSKWTWRPVRCARQHKKCISEITFLFSWEPSTEGCSLAVLLVNCRGRVFDQIYEAGCTM